MYNVIFRFDCVQSGKKGFFRSQFLSKESFESYLRCGSFCDCLKVVFESYAEAEAILVMINISEEEVFFKEDSKPLTDIS